MRGLFVTVDGLKTLPEGVEHGQSLQAGELASEALMEPRSEAQVGIGIPLDPEQMRIVEHAGIAVGRSHQGRDRVAGSDGVSGQFDRLGGGTGIEGLGRRIPAQHFLQRRPHQGAVGPQPLESLGVARHRAGQGAHEQAQGEHTGAVEVAGDEQQQLLIADGSRAGRTPCRWRWRRHRWRSSARSA